MKELNLKSILLGLIFAKTLIITYLLWDYLNNQVASNWLDYTGILLYILGCLFLYISIVKEKKIFIAIGGQMLFLSLIVNYIIEGYLTWMFFYNLIFTIIIVALTMKKLNVLSEFIMDRIVNLLYFIAFLLIIREVVIPNKLLLNFLFQ